jgi:hypothetical protein
MSPRGLQLQVWTWKGQESGVGKAGKRKRHAGQRCGWDRRGGCKSCASATTKPHTLAHSLCGSVHVWDAPLQRQQAAPLTRLQQPAASQPCEAVSMVQRNHA